jgi:hypothetical protein
VELGDLEDCARLISVYIKRLGADTDFLR